VLLSMGTPCKLRNLVDKPSLNGQIGTIESNGADDTGKVTVSVEGRDVKVEEFQVTVTTDEEELKQIRERALLRAAEVSYKFDQRGDRLKRRQMLYVTLGQVTVGLLLVFIILLDLQSEFGAMASFREVFERIPTGWTQWGEGAFHDNSISWQDNILRRRQGKEYVLAQQAKLCPIWSKCITGSPSLNRPGFEDCGACLLPRPSSISTSDLVRKTYSEGNLFQGASMTSIIIYASVGGAIGLFGGFFFMRSVAKVGYATSFSTSLVMAILCAVVTVSASSFPDALTVFSPLPESICSAEDIDPDRPLIQRVTAECLQIAAAVDAKDSFVVGARLSVMGVLVNMLVFIVESLTNLANAIRARGPSLWAKFEAEVFFAYFCIVAVCLATMSILKRNGNLDAMDDLYANNTAFGADVTNSHHLGSNFPLTLDARWVFQRQQHIGSQLWYESGGNTVPTLSVVAFIQITAICSGYIGYFFPTTFYSDNVWIYTMRYALILDLLLLISFYGALMYMSVIAINIVHNIVAILIIPVNVQFFFAALYAVQSDVLPVFSNLPINPVINFALRIAYVSPFACIFVITFGYSYYTYWGFNEGVSSNVPEQMSMPGAQDTGIAIMAIGGSILGCFILGVIFFFFYVVNAPLQYYIDWSTMAADKLAQLYPSVFGKKPDEDDEEEEEAEEEAKTDKPAAAGQVSMTVEDE